MSDQNIPAELESGPQTAPEFQPQPVSITPMVRQYQEIKARHRDKILLFRVGDFYEMFFDDAKEAAEILHIALTARADIPMCGFPHHASNQYIQKLIAAGKKAAVCEQVEDPAKAKGLVKRDIVSVITPGTIIDEGFVSQKQNNFLCSVYSKDGILAVSFVDISTNDFYAITTLQETEMEKSRMLQDEIARYTPSEIIYNEKLRNTPLFLNEIGRAGILAEAFPEWYFEDDFLKGRLEEIPAPLAGDAVLKRSVSGALRYLHETQGIGNADFFQTVALLLKNLQIVSKTAAVEMDDFTLRNLELIRNMQDGGKKFTLLEVLDSTITPMGGRLLRRWITLPLADIKKLYERQNQTESFFDDSILTAKTRDILKKISDIDRLTARIGLKKTIPRDFPALSASLKSAIELKKLLCQNSVLKILASGIEEMNDLVSLIDRAVREEPSSTFGGEVIRDGFNEELDRLRRLLHEGKDWIIQLQNRERERTGITSLKIKYNNVFGYFIEISKANLNNVPEEYMRKQSLVNAERYTIPELSEYETQINSASERVTKLEEELYNALVEEAARYTAELQSTAGTIALVDVYSNFALIARENNYIKPQLDMESDFLIEEGRHPVVERYIGQSLFVPNDTSLDDDENRILILTGPNMAGKSTFLRQNALIAIMAQIGSFVPARKAKIGLIDKIFTRIGASDNLSQGQSTFLVEMQEAANILRASTNRSLIIMDELGRGTSTYDGLSIAWAVVEYLHEHKEKGGKTLFATHYHELTQLGEKRGIQNYNIAVREFQDELVFLRKVIAGPADRSYGIYVAKLAGIPQEIIERAKIVLETLESEGNTAGKRIEVIFDRDYRKEKLQKKNSSAMELFPDNMNEAIVERIRNLDVNSITPLEAITFLAEIKKQLKK